MMNVTMIEQLLDEYLPHILAASLTSVFNNMITLLWYAGVQILIFLAALQKIDTSLYEAAKMDGGSGWECFWKITVPMISPMILVNLLYSFINAFTGSGNTIMEQIRSVTFGSFKFGLGAAMSWVYFGFILLLVAMVYLATSRLVKKEEKR